MVVSLAFWRRKNVGLGGGADHRRVLETGKDILRCADGSGRGPREERSFTKKASVVGFCSEFSRIRCVWCLRVVSKQLLTLFIPATTVIVRHLPIPERGHAFQLYAAYFESAPPHCGRLLFASKSDRILPLVARFGLAEALQKFPEEQEQEEKEEEMEVDKKRVIDDENDKDKAEDKDKEDGDDENEGDDEKDDVDGEEDEDEEDEDEDEVAGGENKEQKIDPGLKLWREWTKINKQWAKNRVCRKHRRMNGYCCLTRILDCTGARRSDG